MTSFLKEYERIQETIYENEAQADHETSTKKIEVIVTLLYGTTSTRSL
jgi:hypothetical protein